MNNFFKKYQSEFSAYYNMARQNAYITLQHISNIMGYKEGEGKESRLFEMQSVMQVTKEKPNQQIFLLKQLSRFFPVLRIMAECERKKGQIASGSPESIRKVLVNIFNVLNYERDRASHLSFVDERTDSEKYIEKERQVAYYLNHCYTVAVRTIKTRFGKETKDMEIFTKERYKFTTEFVDGKKIRKAEINYNFPFSMVDKDKRLTDLGRVFLISLFIEKRYASIFFDSLQTNNKSDIYKNLNEEQKSLLREIFSAFRIRLPKERLGNERSDILLALDMLNELKKAPQDLFEHLKPEDQDKFRIKSTTGDDILLRRSEDRFHFFAMRYIDEKRLFNNIRFQVNMGKYRFLKKEDKHCINDEHCMRILQKDINGFGRLQEMEDYRCGISDLWKSRSMIKPHTDITRNDPNILPYITDSRTQYVFNGDRIGLGWPGYSSSEGKSLPVRNSSYIPEVSSDNTVECAQPKCWISIYEIPAMVFHILLNGNSGVETEKLIKDEVEKYKRFFQDIADGNVQRIKCKDIKNPKPAEYRPIEEKYGIEWSDIPDKLKDFLVGRTRKNFNNYAETIINKMIDANTLSISRFKEKIDKVSGDDNKMGKDSYVEIRPGRLAAFLMKDIIALQPSALKGELKGKDKLTGLNYSILNAELAMYNAMYDEKKFNILKDMFEKAGLIAKANPIEKANNIHPFLGEVFESKPKNTIEFYQSYMDFRLKWLKSILDTKNFKSVNLLKPDRTKWMNRNAEFYRNLAKRYLSQPIELPRSLFESSIVDKMIEICTDNDNLQELKEQLIRYRNNEEGVRFNVTYLILKYHESVKNDKSQKFYGWDKGYKVIDKLEGGKCFNQTGFLEEYDFKRKIDNYIDTFKIKLTGNNYRRASDEEKDTELKKIEKYRKELDMNERTLRRLKVQDILMFYMAKNIIGSDVDNFKMNGISPDIEDEGILELKIPFSMKITLSDGTEKTIYQEAIKIKNYGDFFCYLYDDRVKSLLPQISKAEIDRMELDRELMNYDLTRPQIFSLILDFEKSINDKYPDMTKERHGFTDLLNRLEILDSKEKENIRLVRNAFSHNKYPNIENIKNDIPEIAVGIKKSFIKDTNKIIK
ncbi:MAG TPA: type VI-B CRISPR-associated RNA-guided ribonuclease Cas13b [Bacteroidaceae bacterium]|nr:type VI-B CRISPR-associated RNA-guided ribonuclease Cas13b [Bacteroidaceae bacterium]